MSVYGRSRETSASPDHVWEIWSDAPKWPEWNPSCTKMELDGPWAENVNGRMHTPSGRVHQVSFHNIDPGHAYEMYTKVIPGTQFQFRCEITPQPGGSVVKQSIRIVGPLGFVLGPLAGPGVAKSFDKVLDGLKARVESA